MCSHRATDLVPEQLEAHAPVRGIQLERRVPSAVGIAWPGNFLTPEHPHRADRDGTATECLAHRDQAPSTVTSTMPLTIRVRLDMTPTPFTVRRDPPTGVRQIPNTVGQVANPRESPGPGHRTDEATIRFGVPDADELAIPGDAEHDHLDGRRLQLRRRSDAAGAVGRSLRERHHRLAGHRGYPGNTPARITVQLLVRGASNLVDNLEGSRSER